MFNVIKKIIKFQIIKFYYWSLLLKMHHHQSITYYIMEAPWRLNLSKYLPVVSFIMRIYDMSTTYMIKQWLICFMHLLISKATSSIGLLVYQVIQSAIYSMCLKPIK